MSEPRKQLIHCVMKSSKSKEQIKELEKNLNLAADRLGCTFVVTDNEVELKPDGISQLADAIREQSKSIDRLCDINMQMLQALLESDDEEQEPRNTYMDGSPVG